MRFLGPGELASTTSLEEILESRELVVAYGSGVVDGLAAATLLFSDYAVLHAQAQLRVASPEAWAAAAWRLGRTVIGWAVDGGKQEELVDEITGREPQSWLEEWMRHRSVMALDSAALLIRARGGDRLERAEFARLFAIGEPQTGLGAFLAKIKPTF
ncbi:MAG TPA: hypothetical protein VHW00_05300 [Thermoanaerobaculia bacterium]|nr:hypothetical protein [Thermoanaerobaculia bacterium]